MTTSDYLWGANSLSRAKYYSYYGKNVIYITKIQCLA